jgi:MoaA/NifB/PqqE/SkfB family radical SAM enzyme
MSNVARFVGRREGKEPLTAIDGVIWDLTYACPLRCTHCFTESGDRRPAQTLARKDMLKVLDAILRVKPNRVILSGGEPLGVRWSLDAATALRDAGIRVYVYSSGWIMDRVRAERIAEVITGVAISIDGADPVVNDAIRGRDGAFARAHRALGILSEMKAEREQAGEPCYSLGVDCTVTRQGFGGMERFVKETTSKFPNLDFVRFGAVVPVGVAQEEAFVASQVLTDDQMEALAGSQPRLAEHACNGVDVQVTDVRFLLAGNELSEESESLAHIEASGHLRAHSTFEAKVGSVLEEPLDVLWQRALAWRADPYVAAQRQSIRSLQDWARVTRTLDRRYGSAADRQRIDRRASLR